MIALDCGADQPVVWSCIRIVLSVSPSFKAPFVQSIAAVLSSNSSGANKSGSISATAFRALASPIGLRLATFLPLLGPPGPRLGPAALGGPLLGPAPPGGPLLGPPGLRLGPAELGGPLFGPAPPGGPRD